MKKISEGAVIRSIRNGKPYLVILVGKPCMLVVDLENKNDPVPLKAILPRDFDYYHRDQEMNCISIRKTFSFWSDVKNIYTIAPSISI